MPHRMDRKRIGACRDPDPAEQRQAPISGKGRGEELHSEKILPPSSMFFSCRFWILTFHLLSHADAMIPNTSPRRGCASQSVPFLLSGCYRPSQVQSPLHQYLTEPPTWPRRSPLSPFLRQGSPDLSPFWLGKISYPSVQAAGANCSGGHSWP